MGILTIDVVAPGVPSEEVLEAAEPIIRSVEFHSEGS